VGGRISTAWQHHHHQNDMAAQHQNDGARALRVKNRIGSRRA